MKKFDKLEKVDIHKLWDGGVTDFIPWLSEEENIVELGNATGMELDVQDQEQNAGVFKADILCKDVLTDRFVLIENQLERTDHTHLGQLIAHAAVLEAATVIWITSVFDEEHFVALNWLNKITNESFNIFGIEIDAYKIGDSLPAPKFNVIVKPDGWTKQAIKPISSQKLSNTELLKLEYWQGLKNFMEANNSFVKLLGTPPKSWFNISDDKGKYFLSVTINPQESSLNIWLNIIGEKAKDDFDRLSEIAYKDSLIEVNHDLRWYKIHSQAGCTITLKTYADFMEKNDWTNQFAWFKENLEKFDKFFRTKIKELKT
jgi:hypothetical protein